MGLAIDVKRELGNLNGLICQINVLCDDDELEILRNILNNRINDLDRTHLSIGEREHLDELRSAFSNKCQKFKKAPLGSSEQKKEYHDAVDLLDERMELFLQ